MRNRRRWTREVIAEAWRSLGAKPSRTLATSLGVAAGVALLVVSVGISDSAGRAIVARLAEGSGARIAVSVRPNTSLDGIPPDAAVRVHRLTGVEAAGTITELETALVTSLDLHGQSVGVELPLFAASPEIGDTLGAWFSSGAFFDSLAVEKRLPVAVVGAGAAEQLQIHSVADLPTIRIRGTVHAVVGVIGDIAAEPAVLNGVVLPEPVATRHGFRVAERMEIRTRPEWRDAVATVVATAVSPAAPDAMQVLVPPGEAALQRSVSRELDAMLLALGLMTSLVGAIAASNVMLMSVLERRAEIGLRRALGARRNQVAGQILVEAATVGALGAVLGTSAGVVAVVAIATANGWIPAVPGLVPLIAPIGGVIVGMVAGAVPARRATLIEPIQALQGG